MCELAMLELLRNGSCFACGHAGDASASPRSDTHIFHEFLNGKAQRSQHDLHPNHPQTKSSWECSKGCRCKAQKKIRSSWSCLKPRRVQNASDARRTENTRSWECSKGCRCKAQIKNRPQCTT